MRTKISKVQTDIESTVSEREEIFTPEPREEKKKINKLQLAIALVLLAVIILGGYKWYDSYRKSPEAIAKKNEKEKQEIIEKVKELIILPDTVSPQILKIDDPTLLASQQTFFAGSVKGDYLLIYQEISKAIIYSPSRHILVNVGPISSGETASPTPQIQNIAPSIDKEIGEE